MYGIIYQHNHISQLNAGYFIIHGDDMEITYLKNGKVIKTETIADINNWKPCMAKGTFDEVQFSQCICKQIGIKHD